MMALQTVQITHDDKGAGAIDSDQGAHGEFLFLFPVPALREKVKGGFLSEITQMLESID
jgi:hypothetical protein